MDGIGSMFTKKTSDSLPDNLQKIRKLRRLTQQELADKLGITASSIGQYETGITRPKIEVLLKISQELQISLDQLLGNKFETTPVKEPEEKVRMINYESTKAKEETIVRLERDLQQEREEKRQLLEQNRMLTEMVNNLVGKSSASENAYHIEKAEKVELDAAA